MTTVIRFISTADFVIIYALGIVCILLLCALLFLIARRRLFYSFITRHKIISSAFGIFILIAAGATVRIQHLTVSEGDGASLKTFHKTRLLFPWHDSGITSIDELIGHISLYAVQVDTEDYVCYRLKYWDSQLYYQSTPIIHSYR